MIEGPAALPIAPTEKPVVCPVGVETMIGFCIAAGSMNELGMVGVPSTGNTTTGTAAVPVAGSCAMTTHTTVAPVFRNAA